MAENINNYEDVIEAPQSGLFVAREDYTKDGKSFFTYQGILDAKENNDFPQGFRLMTALDAEKLIHEFGSNPLQLMKALNLGFKGFIEDYKMKSYNSDPASINPTIFENRMAAYYRLDDYSNTSEQARMLYAVYSASDAFVKVGNSSPNLGFCVRLVRDMPA